MKFSINWPKGFVSAIPSKKPSKTPPQTEYERQQKHRKAGGFDRHPIGLDGSKPYVSTGPVKEMTR